MPKDTTPSFPGFCAIRADRPTNQRGGGLLTLIRDDLVFQKAGEEYSPPLEPLTVQVQLSRRKWATIHNIYAAPIRSAGITDTLDIARLQMDHLTFLGGDLNAHSRLWDTNQSSDARGEQLEDWVIAHPYRAQIRIRGLGGIPGMLTGKRSRNQCAPSKCKI